MPRVDTNEDLRDLRHARFVALDFVDHDRRFYIVTDAAVIEANKVLLAKQREEYALQVRFAMRGDDKTWYRGCVADMDEIVWTAERPMLIMIEVEPENPRAGMAPGQRRAQVARRKKSTRRR